MRVKLFIFLLGVLLLTQMILFLQLYKENERKWEAALKDLDARITAHQSEIIETERRVKAMENALGNVPDAIRKGVEDPEKNFLKFMDYLDNSELSLMHGSYDISSEPTIIYKPVPLQKTDFFIQFEFENPRRLESVLGYLLNQQQDYPLNVNRLEITRRAGHKPLVELEISLLLPPKIDQEASSLHKKGGAHGG